MLLVVSAGVLVWVTASFVVSFRRSPPPVHMVVGERADSNIYSEVPFRHSDLVQTQRQRRRAAREVLPIYRLNPPAVEATLQRLSALGEALRAPAGGTEAPRPAPKADAVAPAPGAALEPVDGLDAATLEALRLAVAEPTRFRTLRDLVRDHLNRGVIEERELVTLQDVEAPTAAVTLLNDQAGTERTSVLRTDDLRDPRRAAAAAAAEYASRFPDTTPALRAGLETVLGRLLRPTLTYAADATERARRQAAAAVETVTRFVGANEVLVLRGETVTAELLERLQRHQQELHLRQTTQSGWAGIVQGILLCGVMVLSAGFILSVVHTGLLGDGRLLIMVTLVTVVQMLLSRVVADLHFLKSGSSFFLFPLLPLAFGAMLLAPLAGLRAALVSGLLTTAVTAWHVHSPESFHLCVTGTVTCLLGGALMRRARRRSHLIRTGTSIFVAVLLLELVFSIRATLPPGALWRSLAPLATYALGNAFGVTAVVFILLPLLEYVFGAASDLTLVELSDLNHPLLKRLQLEAPGTYHHSLTVATLAEQAAEAIGANPLMARVCAYFHDIGKLHQPEFFTENVAQGVNPHRELEPRMSSLVILNHVREGLSLARQYKLKRPLREAIAQHHGTSLVYFFYRKALDQEKPGQAVGESEFRYPGPKPRRKEVVLVSLADTCEAACRSLERPTPGKIADKIEELFYDRVRNHELDDADLTFSELTRVREAMVRTLSTMMHARVPYPKESDREGAPVQAGAAATAAEPPPAAAPPA